MAIDKGLLVACGDLNAVGGIRQILLTDLAGIWLQHCVNYCLGAIIIP